MAKFNQMQFAGTEVGALDGEPDLDGKLATGVLRRRAEDRSGLLGYRQSAHSPVAVRAPLDALPPILQSGEIRTQHETGSSKGTYDPRYRAKWEKHVAGFSDHPVYGYLDTGDKERAIHYGGAKFRLKGHMRDRTTVMNGDSLGSSYVPAPLREVEKTGEIPHTFHGRDTGIDGKPYIEGYIEAQIHNPPSEGPPYSRVPLSDVASVDIDWTAEPWKRHYTYEEQKNLSQQFADKGANVWHHREVTDYQPPLPFDQPETLGFHKDHEGRYVREDRRNITRRKAMFHHSQL